MKILITGATGLLGSRFYHILGKYNDIVGTYFSNPKEDFQYLSLTDKNSIDSLISEIRPDIVIHTAGITGYDRCEKNRKEAYEVNVKGTEYIVDACNRNKSSLVFISTSHIFSEGGLSEKNATDPISYYGQTKLEAENYIRRNLKDYIILRTTELYGLFEDGEDFTKTVIKETKNGKELRLDNSLKYYPVITDDLVELTRSLIDVGFRGTYNVSISKPYTKFEWAKIIAETFNLKKNKIKPIKKKKSAKFPMDLLLSTEKIKRLRFTPIPLKKGVNQLRKQMGCTFDLVYSFRPYKLIKGRSATVFRVNLGKALAKEESAKFSGMDDIVVPIPESGIYPAQGYADGIGVPMYHAVIRDYERKKTLYEPEIKKRYREIRKKLIVIPEIVNGKKIILVDEAIISGLTMVNVIEKLKEAGAKEIHIRIPSPIMFNNCRYNVLARDAKLIADDFNSHNKKIIERKLAKHFGVESLKYLTLRSFKNVLPDKRNACVDCFLKKEL